MLSVDVCWVLPQVILWFLSLVVAVAVVPFQKMLRMLMRVIHTFWVKRYGIGVRATLRLALLQVLGLGLTQGAAFVGQRWRFFNMRGPLKGLVILEAKAHPHLYREAAVFIDQNALFDIVVHDPRLGLGVGFV